MADDDLLTADQIAGKINGMRPRATCRSGANHLTMFIDVQQNLLFYVVAAWEDDFHRLRHRLRHLSRPEAAVLHAPGRPAHAGDRCDQGEPAWKERSTPGSKR